MLYFVLDSFRIYTQHLSQNRAIQGDQIKEREKESDVCNLTVGRSSFQVAVLTLSNVVTFTTSES